MDTKKAITRLKISLGQKVIVGWSGGGDSTALLLALQEAGAKVIALHIDHGWREDRSEVNQLGAELKKMGIEVNYLVIDGKRDSNREGHARTERFKAFKHFLEENESDTIYLGHNLDDQIETIIMRKDCKSGWKGLRGILEENTVNGVRIKRPLLSIRREELRSFLRKRNIKWVEDPSNQDNSILRNWIRNVRLPELRKTQPAIDNEMINIHETAMVKYKVLDQLFDKLVKIDKRVAVVNFSEIKTLIQEELAHVLQRTWETIKGKGKTPGRRHILLIKEWIDNGWKGGLDLNGVRMERKGKKLLFMLKNNN